MKITNGIKIAACSILLSACSQAPRNPKVLKEIYPNGTYGRILKEAAVRSRDSLDSTYHLFARDTVNVGKDYKVSVEKILKKINNLARNKAVIKKLGYTKSANSDEYKCIEHKLYNETKGVIKSNKVYKLGDDDIYIPVEYYGR